eukprot:TRINITY_DN14405_c0_g1_i3.p1 TRINITY_DN14405_c0_g1~~TRINITY_DN14405_c0_g1_i3.p1  ORF type:complete len:144 (-),score=14.77 TRINITY_DN14405_c0_g1_i3:5-436(-)
MHTFAKQPSIQQWTLAYTNMAHHSGLAQERRRLSEAGARVLSASRMYFLSTTLASVLDMCRNESKVSVGFSSCSKGARVSGRLPSALATSPDSSSDLEASDEIVTRLRAERDRFTFKASQEVDCVGLALSLNMLDCDELVCGE